MFNGGNGVFWSTQVVPGFPTSGPGGTKLTWAALNTAMPNAAIRLGFGPNMGTGPAFNGSVDKVVFGVGPNDTTFDFEPQCTTTCFVATTGSDLNTGRSGDPFLTVQKALNTVSAGGTVNVADGTYNISATTTIPVSVTLQGASRAGTILERAASRRTRAESSRVCR